MKNVQTYRQFQPINESENEEIGRVKFGTDNDIVVKKGPNFYVITQKSKIDKGKTNTVVISDDNLEEFLKIFAQKNETSE